MKKQKMTFVNLALALADDYHQLFVIDPQDDSYVEYALNGEEKELVSVSKGGNFFESVVKNCREQVFEEDQEYFLNAFQKENVTQALKNGKSFSMTYRLNIEGIPRYFFLKTIRCSDQSIVIGVQDIDEQKRKELQTEKEKRIYSEIAESLASLFEVIYHVDTATGNYIQYSSSENYAKLGFRTSGENFFENTQQDIQKVVCPEDCERVMYTFKKENLLKQLKKCNSFSITYRQMADGTPQYMQMLAFRLQDSLEHIVISVRNINEQKKSESASETYSHIAEALASRYEVIYYINADTHAYTQYSASQQYAKLGTTKEGTDFFIDAADDVKKYIHPDDMQKLLLQLSEEYLVPNLKQNGLLSISYRQLLEDKYQYMNMTIVQPKNDLHHIIVGVFNTDKQVRRELSIAEKSRTFGDIANALAQRYEIIYHVNILTNEYFEYSTSSEYSRLKSGTKGKDFFKEAMENMQNSIYPDDLPMMTISMQKENLLNSLSAFGKTILNYRLLINGTPQYVSLYAVRPMEDSKHIIIAVANVDAAKRMELAYQNAVDMANRDALTGVKNKRAYVQFETELDEQIKNKENPAFAVVICDINGLKQVNDTQGHKAGDEFIRKACSVICNVFKHSPVFRIGGDEFAVILRGQDYLHRRELMNNLQDILNQNKCQGLALLAFGISEFEAQKDMRVQDVFERSDMLMYTNKKYCKSIADNKGGEPDGSSNE